MEQLPTRKQVTRFLENIIIGFQAYWKAGILIFSTSLFVYFAIPAVLSLALYLGGKTLIDDLRLVSFADIPDTEFEVNALVIGIKGVLVFILLRMNNYVVLILLTPLMTRLSVITERLLTGNRYPLSIQQYLKDIMRGVQISLRNMAVHMLWIIIWYLLAFLLPPLRQASPYVLFIIGFYFYGFSLMDYTHERLRWGMEDSVKFVRKNASLAFILGGVFSCLFVIPYAGVALAPVAGIVAATIAMDDVVNLKKNPHAIKG